MGNSSVKSVTNLNKIHSIEEFKHLIDSDPINLHKQMCNEKKGLQIFICRRWCENDTDDEEHKKEVMEDYIMSHYKHQYYIAELTFEQTEEWTSIANLIWFTYEDVMSWSYNIYELHDQFKSYKKCVLLRHFTPVRSKRTTGHMSDDFAEIYKKISKLDYENIEKCVCEELSHPDKLKIYKKLNKKFNGFYDRVYENECKKSTE